MILEGTKLAQLDRSEESSKLLADYYRMLDSSFEPALSTYVDIDAYSDKLVKNAYVAVFTKDEEFVGTFSLYINNPQKTVAYLSSFAVLPKYKGVGYTDFLIAKMIDIALNSGFRAIKLEVKSSYLRAISFYMKHGFIRSEEKTGNDSTFYMYMNLRDDESK